MKDKLAEFGTKLKANQEKMVALEKEKGDKKDEDVPAELKAKIDEVKLDADSIRREQTDLLTQWGKSHKAVRQLIDLALLSNNMLRGEALSNFVKRSLEMIKK